MFPVAVFFLLSGYVIEISLRKLGALPFLVARGFRIYPTFAVCLLAYLVVYYLLGRELPPTGKIFSNLFLYGSFAVVPVSWTLIAEVKYYVVVALLSMIVTNGPARHLVIIGAFVVFGRPDGFWLGFMSIGALMYYVHQQKDESAYPSVALIVGITAWYIARFLLHPTDYPYKSELEAALVVFTITVTLIRNAAVPRVLVYLGDISYPLYCIHYIVIVAVAYFLGAHLPGIAVQILPLPIAIALAHVIHVFIEKPSNEAGKSIAIWLDQNVIQAFKQRRFFRGGAGGMPDTNSPQESVA